jgi:hypothetical protein
MSITPHLSKIVDAFNTDSIVIKYHSKNRSTITSKVPQYAFVNDVANVRTLISNKSGIAVESYMPKIMAIELPNSAKVNFLYSSTFKYSDNDYVLSRIKIMDPDFKYGYLLDYQDSIFKFLIKNGNKIRLYDKKGSRPLLAKITPYTAKEYQSPYLFGYDNPVREAVDSTAPHKEASPDHWGYWGNYNADSMRIPKLPQYTWGANRNVQPSNTLAGILKYIKYPTGGWTQFTYLSNSAKKIINTKQKISINFQNSVVNQSIQLQQVYNDCHQLSFQMDGALLRNTSLPFTGIGMLDVFIKNAAGTATLLSTTISLTELYTNGLKNWRFKLPSGTYTLQTALNTGGATTFTGAMPVNIVWNNRTEDAAYGATVGGLRIFEVIKYENDTIGEPLPDDAGQYNFSGAAGGEKTMYIYAFEDGKPSGFLNEQPKYDYPFTHILQSNNTATNYTAITSEPVNSRYEFRNAIGHSRLEVRKMSTGGKPFGKTVYEFTDAKDANINPFASSFPFAAAENIGWAIGYPKSIMVYDSNNVLLTKKVMKYTLDSATLKNDNFKSLTLGHNQSIFSQAGIDNNLTGLIEKRFIGEPNYIKTGIMYLNEVTDTFFFANGTNVNTNKKMYYDANYNINKVVSNYDKSRGLQLETRMYYPYNYTVGGAIGTLNTKGILSYLVSSENWIIGDANTRMLSSGVTLYKQLSNGAIRPDSIFTLISAKPVPESTIGTFNSNVLIRNRSLLLPQQIMSVYDNKLNLLETKNMNSAIYSAVIHDTIVNYPIAQVTNALYNDIAYTSFENTFYGNWSVASNTKDTLNAITGTKSYILNNGNITRTGLNSSKQYWVTLWALTGASVSVNGAVMTNALRTQNGWNLFRAIVTGTSTITVTGNGIIDELRLYPKEATMTTQHYVRYKGIASTVDAKDVIGYLDYDDLNRIKLVKDKNKNILRKYEYADSAFNINVLPKWVLKSVECNSNAIMDSTFIDQNIFSDSYLTTIKATTTTYNCSCPAASGNPQYKIVYGLCEKGNLDVSSSVWRKINLPDGTQAFKWVCEYRYCFSDGSMSANVINTTYNDQSCPVLCGAVN